MLKITGLLLTGCILAAHFQDVTQSHDGHIAEEDIDTSSFDAKSPPKKLKSSPLDDIEFVSEADEPPKLYD